MNILYGVQGTGNGHISRSREIVRCLKKRGHRVEVIISGRNQELLWDMEIFQPYVVYRGLTFATSKGKINFTRTARELDLPQFFYDIHTHKTENIDLVISDFEPISARIARNSKLPSMGIGHQYAFWHDIPHCNGNYLARLILKKYAPVEIPVGLHWHHFNQPILPPIIPVNLKTVTKTIPGKILVYLPFENLNDIAGLVLPLEKYEFYIYHAMEKADNIGNLRLRPFSRAGFLKDLEECSHVICSAGFELVSEALSLGKKILVKPLQGQMEQYANAYALSRLKLGMTMDSLDRQIVEEFLDSHDAKQVTYPYVALLFTEWLERGRWHDVDSLAAECWRQTN